MTLEAHASPSADSVSMSDGPVNTSLLLSGLEEPERLLLAPLFTSVELEPEHLLYEAGQPIEYIYFPQRGAVSLTRSQDGRVVEVGTIGREGVVGSSVLLLTPMSVSRTFVQFGGEAQRMRTDDLLG